MKPYNTHISDSTLFSFFMSRSQMCLELTIVPYSNLSEGFSELDLCLVFAAGVTKQLWPF